jgi:hypothetical protein
MLSIVFGLIAICLGLFGIVTYWWYVVDMRGFVALMAGIKNSGLKAKIRESSEKTAEETEE